MARTVITRTPMNEGTHSLKEPEYIEHDGHRYLPQLHNTFIVEHRRPWHEPGTHYDVIAIWELGILDRAFEVEKKRAWKKRACLHSVDDRCDVCKNFDKDGCPNCGPLTHAKVY